MGVIFANLRSFFFKRKSHDFFILRSCRIFECVVLQFFCSSVKIRANKKRDKKSKVNGKIKDRILPQVLIVKKNIPLILCSNKFNDNRGGNPIISDQIEAAAASGFQRFA